MWILFKQNTKQNKIGDLVDVEEDEAKRLIQEEICREVSDPHDININSLKYIQTTRRN